MAWVGSKNANKIGGQMKAFEKMPNSTGNMQAKPTGLHHATMMPLGNPTEAGNSKQFGNSGGLGNPTAGALGGPVRTSVQSPAQHAATVKAGRASGATRKKAW